MLASWCPEIHLKYASLGASIRHRCVYHTGGGGGGGWGKVGVSVLLGGGGVFACARAHVCVYIAHVLFHFGISNVCIPLLCPFRT